MGRIKRYMLVSSPLIVPVALCIGLSGLGLSLGTEADSRDECSI